MIYQPSTAEKPTSWMCRRCDSICYEDNRSKPMRFCPYCGTLRDNELRAAMPYTYNEFKRLTIFKDETIFIELREWPTAPQFIKAEQSGRYSIKECYNGVFIVNTKSEKIMLHAADYGVFWRCWGVTPSKEWREYVPWISIPTQSIAPNEWTIKFEKGTEAMMNYTSLNSVITAPPLTKKEYS